MLTLPQFEADGVYGSILTCVLLLSTTFTHLIDLKNISYLLAIIISLDTITGSLLKNWLTNKIKTIFHLTKPRKKKNENN